MFRVAVGGGSWWFWSQRFSLALFLGVVLFPVLIRHSGFLSSGIGRGSGLVGSGYLGGSGLDGSFVWVAVISVEALVFVVLVLVLALASAVVLPF